MSDVRALTLDHDGTDLPPDTPLTVGQLLAVLDGNAAPNIDMERHCG